jgi:hypothetical protein
MPHMAAIEGIRTTAEAPSKLDAALIGGPRWSYQLHRFYSRGLAVKGFNTASKVGGTWYWNRHPDASFDLEDRASRMDQSDGSTLAHRNDAVLLSRLISVARSTSPLSVDCRG